MWRWKEHPSVSKRCIAYSFTDLIGRRRVFWKMTVHLLGKTKSPADSVKDCSIKRLLHLYSKIYGLTKQKKTHRAQANSAKTVKPDGAFLGV